MFDEILSILGSDADKELGSTTLPNETGNDNTVSSENSSDSSFLEQNDQEKAPALPEKKRLSVDADENLESIKE